MYYTQTSEKALLKTIVEEEVEEYETRFGKAVCPEAKVAFAKKIVWMVFAFFTAIACFVLMGTVGLFMFSGNLTTFLFVIIFIKIVKGAGGKITFPDFFGSMNPIVHYVMKLAKENPDQKIRDILYRVCENTTGSYVTDDERMSSYHSSCLASMKGRKTSAQSWFLKVLPIVSILLVTVCIAGIGGYFMIPRVQYVDVDNGCMVQDYNLGFSLGGKAVIPEQYNGKPVVAIGDGAFKGDLFLKTVELPDTISSIGGEAFQNCHRLESITLPAAVTELRGNTFENCTSLEFINIPDTVVEIHCECFRNCKDLQIVKLSENITEIKGNTFEGCSALQSITIPLGVTRIAAHAFYGCRSLSYVSVPTSVESIGSSAFRRCDSLYEISLPDGVVVNERAFKESPTSISYYMLVKKGS